MRIHGVGRESPVPFLLGAIYIQLQSQVLGLEQRKRNIPDVTELQFNYKGRSKRFKQS